MEIPFASLEALTTEVAARRGAGRDVLEADDPKERMLGFVDLATGDYLFVSFARLTTAQLEAHLAEKAGGETQPDPTLEGLWDERILEDAVDFALEVAEGERDAAEIRKQLPTPEQTKIRVTAVEAGIRAAGLGWKMCNPPASPFTFSWGTQDYRKNDARLKVSTDHLGVTVQVGKQIGNLWCAPLGFAARLAWADALDVSLISEWISEQVGLALSVYEAFPQCECASHQKIRAGLIK